MTGRKHQATLPSLPPECSNTYARTTGDVQGSAVAPATITSTALGIVGHLNRDSALDTRFAHRGSIWARSRARCIGFLLLQHAMEFRSLHLLDVDDCVRP